MDLDVLYSCLKNVDSRYRAVLVAARRAKMLMKGSRPLAYAANDKATAHAMQELAENKLRFFTREDALAEAEAFFSSEENIVSSTDVVDSFDQE
ncbi:DNA-directed RNA polymerase subunit omega [bacterium]|nr:DNA-directed RNA polymerase subunit omega [candidate division CSSED10-310 bacterium]